MKAQAPAEGILKTHEWGTSKMYKVVCACGSEDDTIDFTVEADDAGVMVTTYTTQKTDYWTETVNPNIGDGFGWIEDLDYFWKSIFNSIVRKVKLTYQIWVKGYVQYQSTTIMSKQQALNYAETLKAAVKDVEQFNEQRLKS